jgi:hypothetical protein
MALEIKAACVHIQEDEETIILGFADSQYNTQEYILLQRSLLVSESEQALDMHKVHLTVNDERHSAYGAIQSVETAGQALRIHLAPDAASKMQADPELIIYYQDTDVDAITLREILERLFALEPGVLATPIGY